MGELHEIIEDKKEELVRLVGQHGLCHDKVLHLSQIIDELINQLMLQNAGIFASYRLSLAHTD